MRILDGLIKQTEQRDYTSFLARPPSSRLAWIKVDRERLARVSQTFCKSAVSISIHFVVTLSDRD